MILGYMKQMPWGLPTCFKGKIIDGIKIHTIREDIHDRWRAGRRINHCHGVRTKQFENFHNNDCTGTQKITISIVDKIQNPDCYVCCKFVNRKQIERAFEVTVDTKKLSWKDIVILSHNDGFDSADDFFRWFFDGYNGKIIHWTDKRY